jgi:aryl-alcohol dehydrogenase-like predicted oxidoreductase
MNTTHIPGTTLTPSCLCMGTGDFGAGIERTAAYALLDAFHEQGGNFLDTAKIYSDWIPGERSRSEKVIGEWLEMRKIRHEMIVATKGAHFNLETPQIMRLAPEEIIADIDASLKHLRTDFIDMYWLHRDDPQRPVSDIIDTLQSRVNAGKLRYYGCSNWRIERLEEARVYAQQNGMVGFAAVQNLWNLAKVNPGGFADQTIVSMDEALWEYHLEHQLAAIPFTSQANGFFQKMAVGGVDSLPGSLKKTYLNPVTERRFHRLMKLREQTGLTVTQIALGYLLSQPFPTIPIFSSRNMEQLKDSLSAANARLTQDQLAFLLS